MIGTRWFIIGLFVLWGALITGAFIRHSLSTEPIFSQSQNRRIFSEPRGRILDRNGLVLAYGDGNKRHYPLGPAAAHIVGYVNLKAGVGGTLEGAYGNILRAKNRLEPFYFFVKKDYRADLKTTMDAHLQIIADKMLAEKRGAIIVLKIDTGEILVSVSHPNYDPNTIEYDWKKINSQKDAPLFNRVSKGYYHPGSVWKTIGAILLLDRKAQDKDYYCKGENAVGDKTFRCLIPHGHVEGIKDAYARSCNGYFIERILNEVSQDDFLKTTAIFMHRNIHRKLNKTGYALAAIGQDEIEITPIEGALLAATIANRGLMPRPTPVSVEITPKSVIPERVASTVREMMTDVVRKGTGRRLSGFVSKGYTIGVKTGTAEKELKNKDKTNIAWMIGFAGKKMPEIAFAVVVEDSVVHAGEACSPIVSGILSEYFQNRGVNGTTKGPAITRQNYPVTDG